MKTFGEILRKHIEQSGFNIYQYARRTGINRVNIQRYIANQRTPDPEVFAVLMEHLQLQPPEKQELETTYEISKVGKELYFQRLSVKELIESVSLIYKNEKQMETYSQTILANSCYPFVSHRKKDTCVVSGFVNVLYLFQRELGRNALAFENPFAYLFLPPDPRHTFMDAWLVPAKPRQNDMLKITQIFPLAKVNMRPKSQSHNLHVISSILPLCLSTHFQYEAYFYYDDPLNDQNYGILYPYYAILKDCVILFSQDMKSALLSFDPAMVQLYQIRFQKHLLHCQEIIQTTDHFLPQESGVRSFASTALFPQYHVNYAPYLADIVAPQASDIPHYHFFTRQGLFNFAKYGICSGMLPFPEKAVSPEDRRALLTHLCDICKTGPPILHIINPNTFCIPENLNLNVTEETAYLLNYTEHSSWNCISIQESGIRSALADFLSFLPESPYVYTKEQTFAIIKEIVEKI